MGAQSASIVAGSLSRELVALTKGCSSCHSWLRISSFLSLPTGSPQFLRGSALHLVRTSAAIRLETQAWTIGSLCYTVPAWEPRHVRTSDVPVFGGFGPPSDSLTILKWFVNPRDVVCAGDFVLFQAVSDCEGGRAPSWLQ